MTPNTKNCVRTDRYVNISAINIDSDFMSKVEQDIDTYDLISLVFLLYNDPFIAMHYVASQRTGRKSSLLEPWLLEPRSPAWKHEFLQALVVCQLFGVVRKLGLHVATVKRTYHPDNALYLNPRKIMLYHLCENMDSGNLEIFKHILSTYDIDVSKYETCELILLKLMDLKFIDIEDVNQNYDVDNLVLIVDKLRGMKKCADILREFQLNNTRDTITSDISISRGFDLVSSYIQTTRNVELQDSHGYELFPARYRETELNEGEGMFVRPFAVESERNSTQQYICTGNNHNTNSECDQLNIAEQSDSSDSTMESCSPWGSESSFEGVTESIPILANVNKELEINNEMPMINTNHYKKLANSTEQRHHTNVWTQNCEKFSTERNTATNGSTSSDDCDAVSMGYSEIKDSTMKSQSNISHGKKKFYVCDFTEDLHVLEDSLRGEWSRNLKPDKTSIDHKTLPSFSRSWDTKYDSSEIYPIINPNRLGVCFIINQEDFQPSGNLILDKRVGSFKDVILLDKTMKALNFKTIKLENLDHIKMKMIIRHVIQRKVQKDDSVFMLCILTHGFLGSVFASDSVSVKVDEIQNLIGEELQQRGMDIPKLMLVQACQILVADCPRPLPSGQAKSNFLICWATAPELIAFRRLYPNGEGYSIYIEHFCKNLQLFSKSHHMNDILIKVNRGVADMCKSLSANQLSKFDVYLEKQLYLQFPK